MKIILVGTNHSKGEEEIEVVLESVGVDAWTFTVEGTEFTISDLTPIMEFLEEMFKKP